MDARVPNDFITIYFTVGLIKYMEGQRRRIKKFEKRSRFVIYRVYGDAGGVCRTVQHEITAALSRLQVERANDPGRDFGVRARQQLAAMLPTSAVKALGGLL